jgi:hypothetical protein
MADTVRSHDASALSVTGSRLVVSRRQVLAYRLRAAGLHQRARIDPPTLRDTAWAGLQDSMPRAALLSIHARVEGADPSTWEDPSLVQVWGPRFSAYVVPARDIGVFTLGRMPDGAAKRAVAFDLADRLAELLDGSAMPYGEAGRALGQDPNRLRYAAPTGRVLIRWDGARQPVIWTAPPPDIEPGEARVELARRYLHVFGPATVESFSKWAGVKDQHGAITFDALAGSLAPVETPIGEAWILQEDEADLRADPRPVMGVRLLPSGDTHYLSWGADRELLVEDPAHRLRLWTSRVWPGALLVDGEIAGTWRRSQTDVTIDPWRSLSRREVEAVAEEARSLPLPGGPVTVDVVGGLGS